MFIFYFSTPFFSLHSPALAIFLLVNISTLEKSSQKRFKKESERERQSINHLPSVPLGRGGEKEQQGKKLKTAEPQQSSLKSIQIYFFQC